MNFAQMNFHFAVYISVQSSFFQPKPPLSCYLTCQPPYENCYGNILPIRYRLGPFGVSRTNYIMFPKFAVFGQGLDLNCPKDQVLEQSGKPSSCSEHIFWEDSGICHRKPFFYQRLMHRLPSAKMVRMKCQFDNYAILFTHIYYINF